MARILKRHIRQIFPDLLKTIPDRCETLKTVTAGALAAAQIKRTIIGHIGHQRLDVMVIPGIRELFQILQFHVSTFYQITIYLNHNPSESQHTRVIMRKHQRRIGGDKPILYLRVKDKQI